MNETDTTSVKYQLHINDNAQVEVKKKMLEDLRDFAFKINSNCNSCYNRQCQGEKIADIQQNSISYDHIVRSDVNKIAGLAGDLQSPELEKAAEDFAFNYCGRNKKTCEKGRKVFSEDLYPEIKKSIEDVSKEKKNKSSSFG